MSGSKPVAKYALVVAVAAIVAVAAFFIFKSLKLGKSSGASYQLTKVIGSKGRGDGQFLSPRWLCVDDAGNLYVTDYENNRIEKFSPQGDYLAKWGSAGSRPGEFNQPAGLAVHEEQLFVVDSANSRVQVFDLEGNFLKAWGMKGRDIGGFCNPLGIAIDREGSVFVGDAECQRVQKFRPDGKFLSVVVASDKTNRVIPYGLAVTPENNLLIVDIGANIVRSYRNQGALSWALGQSGEKNSFSRVLNVASDAKGNIYTVDSGKKQIHKFNKDGDFISAFSGRGTGVTELKEPLGIAVDQAGNVYVADMGNNQVKKYEPVSAD